jgi:single-stranded-DNA-specific exonuclease
VLINRGIKEVQQAQDFLNPRLSMLHSPYDLPDMSVAVERIKRALRKREKIMIFGDYDADGLTSTVLLKETLQAMGLEVFHYLPHRLLEGYGLNKQAVKKAITQKVDLFITVDCGTNSLAEVGELTKAGIDVIITDHHAPLSGGLPAALAVINPRRPDSRYKFPHLAGVGVVYKFVQAITDSINKESLDLTCLGTIADISPLKGENRIIVKFGLPLLFQTSRIGLRVLIERCGLNARPMDTTAVSYIISPRLNASGRIGSAELSLNLLLSKSEQEARELSELVNSCNSRRQRIEERMLKEACDLIEKEVNFKQQHVIVLAKDGWHRGVLGIVASKITDQFYRPTIVISLEGELCRGSARSIKNFHITQTLLECQHLLVEFGGHKQAAGLVIREDKISHFRKEINHLASEKLLLQDLYPSIDIDAQMNLSDLNEKNINELALLEPFGEANPAPVFCVRNLRLRSEPRLLAKDTIKCYVTDGKLTYPAVGFRKSYLKDSLMNSRSFDLAFVPSLDNYRGQGEIQLEIKDVCISGLNS